MVAIIFYQKAILTTPLKQKFITPRDPSTSFQNDRACVAAMMLLGVLVAPASPYHGVIAILKSRNLNVKPKKTKEQAGSQRTTKVLTK